MDLDIGKLKKRMNESFKLLDETYISVKNIKKGQEYQATDDGKTFKPVKILSVKKDSSGEYAVKVLLLNTNKEDNWYLSPDDEVFKK